LQGRGRAGRLQLRIRSPAQSRGPEELQEGGLSGRKPSLALRVRTLRDSAIPGTRSTVAISPSLRRRLGIGTFLYFVESSTAIDPAPPASGPGLSGSGGASRGHDGRPRHQVRPTSGRTSSRAAVPLPHVGKGDRGGAGLGGRDGRRDHGWLLRYLRAPDQMLAEQDPIAVELSTKYKNVPMPNLRVKADGEIATVLSYWNSQRSRSVRTRGRARTRLPPAEAPSWRSSGSRRRLRW